MTLDFDQVELIDQESDLSIGCGHKLAAHRIGVYHRAISILLIDGAGRHILQRRAASKYHCAGLWANACCSHPAPGESSSEAAARRLREELGISCLLFRLGTIRYRATVPGLTGMANPDGKLIENERVALFCGRWEGNLSPHPREVSETVALNHAGALGMLASRQSPWLRLYLRTFGGELTAIVEACARREWMPRDYGRVDLDLSYVSPGSTG